MEQQDISKTIISMAHQAKEASRSLSGLATRVKNNILLRTGEMLNIEKNLIQEENRKDLEAGRNKGLSSSMLDRLTLSDKVIASMIQGLQEVAGLNDPVGAISDLRNQASGIKVGKMRIPLGVIGMIYESRPNVTIDAAALCLKSGNAVILRGGSEAIHSNRILAKILQKVLLEYDLDPHLVQVVPMIDREAVQILLQQEDYLDLIIPRGGESLIRFVAQNSRIPVLKHYKGVCHAYVDAEADLDMAEQIILNSKVQRPGVCNALEGLLIHQAQALRFIPQICHALEAKNVELRVCEATKKLMPNLNLAQDEDWGQEFLELCLVIKIVNNFDEALDYIHNYGSNHTETIITNSYAKGQRFLREVDASAVMINASTRFNDGAEFGLGTEIGISTTKLHAYGPMGLNELTAQKFVVYGSGEIRT